MKTIKNLLLSYFLTFGLQAQAMSVEQCLRQMSPDDIPLNTVVTIGVDTSNLSVSEVLESLRFFELKPFSLSFPKQNSGEYKYMVEVRMPRAPKNRDEVLIMKSNFRWLSQEVKNLKGFYVIWCSFPQGAVTGNN